MEPTSASPDASTASLPALPPGLADASVLDPDEKPHRLGDAWREHPVVLVFLRHYG
jgi:hypothetical protein